MRERVSGPEDGQKEERKTRPKLAVAILLRLREAAEDAMWKKGKKEDTRRRQGRYAGIGQRPRPCMAHSGAIDKS